MKISLDKGFALVLGVCGIAAAQTVSEPIVLDGCTAATAPTSYALGDVSYSVCPDLRVALRAELEAGGAADVRVRAFDVVVLDTESFDVDVRAQSSTTTTGGIARIPAPVTTTRVETRGSRDMTVSATVAATIGGATIQTIVDHSIRRSDLRDTEAVAELFATLIAEASAALRGPSPD
jgi:hypothetical protein